MHWILLFDKLIGSAEATYLSGITERFEKRDND